MSIDNPLMTTLPLRDCLGLLPEGECRLSWIALRLGSGTPLSDSLDSRLSSWLDSRSRLSSLPDLSSALECQDLFSPGLSLSLGGIVMIVSIGTMTFIVFHKIAEIVSIAARIDGED